MKYTTEEIPISFKHLGGGLNTTSGVLKLKDNESSNLQNVEFSKFGSIVKRLGYKNLNSNIVSSSSAAPYAIGADDDTSYGVFPGTPPGFEIPNVVLDYQAQSPEGFRDSIEMPDVTITHSASK